MAVALFGLHAAIVRFNDIVAEVLKPSNQDSKTLEALSARAIKLVQERDDGLSEEETSAMTTLLRMLHSRTPIWRFTMIRSGGNG